MLEEVLDAWKEVRAGLIAELSQIPAEQFGFQATPDTRSVSEIVHHILESQDFLVGEVCRPDTNFRRMPIQDLMKSYNPQSRSVEGKAPLIELLKTSMETAEARLREFGEDALKEKMQRIDGKTVTKLIFLQFVISHEMHHRGQISVYERLMQLEPALTTRMKQFIESSK
jgi:uncharacterized damage-inducible protein DinB